MQIAYFTHDEVNAVLASRLARRLGLDVTVVDFKNSDQSIAAENMVLDLDHLPSECKSTLIGQAASGGVRKGITVHSYNLLPRETKCLKAAGVRVARKLVACTLVARPADFSLASKSE